MDATSYTLNLDDLGIRVNKDLKMNHMLLSLYEVHQAGQARGHGLFAKRNIGKNEEIIKITGPLVKPEISSTLYTTYGIDVLIQVGRKKWILPNNESRFINRSCNPNMGFRGSRVFIAMRDVVKGEELTFDYAMNEIDQDAGTYDWIMNCVCGSTHCRKKISNKDIFNKRPGLAEKYKGYLPKYVIQAL